MPRRFDCALDRILDLQEAIHPREIKVTWFDASSKFPIKMVS